MSWEVNIRQSQYGWQSICNVICFTYEFLLDRVYGVNNKGVKQMAKVVKTVRIEESLVEKLSEIADKEFGGNATAALESFVSQALASRVMPSGVRWGIYSKVKDQVIDEMDIQRGTKQEFDVISSITEMLGI